jgi:hypothetical protein
MIGDSAPENKIEAMFVTAKPSEDNVLSISFCGYPQMRQPNIGHRSQIGHVLQYQNLNAYSIRNNIVTT